MKKLLLLCLLSGVYSAFSQSVSVDSLLQKLAAEKNEDKKVDLIVSLQHSFFQFSIFSSSQSPKG